MAVRRSKNYWAYKNNQRRRHRVSTAVHEARWGKAIAALLMCLTTCMIVIAMAPFKDRPDKITHAANNAQAQADPDPTGEKLNIALLGDRLQAGIDAAQSEQQQEENQPQETEQPPLDKTPDEELPEVDVPIISCAPREGAAPAVAFTFDDGPNNLTTPRLLDALKERNLKATFFTLGFTSPNTDRTLKRIIEEGHEVGSHTYSHKNLRELDDDELFSEMNDNQELIESFGGNVRYIRPPYGKYDRRVLHYAHDNDCSIITWNIDPEDYKYKNDENGAQKIANHILEKVKDGDIILLHDIHEKSVDAAIILFDELEKRGFQMLTVHELINR